MVITCVTVRPGAAEPPPRGRSGRDGRRRRRAGPAGRGRRRRSSTAPARPRSSVRPRGHDLANRVVRQRLERQQQRARQERRDDREERVLGRGGDQRHPAVLDAGQQRVLLRLAEPVHLVDEQHRLASAAAELRRAASMTSRTSLTPAATAETSTNRRSVCAETIPAMVVLPVPGGPHSSSAVGWSASTSRRSGEPSASRCSWPYSSSRVRGRIRTASGAAAWPRSDRLPPEPRVDVVAASSYLEAAPRRRRHSRGHSRRTPRRA